MWMIGTGGMIFFWLLGTEGTAGHRLSVGVLPVESAENGSKKRKKRIETLENLMIFMAWSQGVRILSKDWSESMSWVLQEVAVCTHGPSSQILPAESAEERSRRMQRRHFNIKYAARLEA